MQVVHRPALWSCILVGFVLTLPSRSFARTFHVNGSSSSASDFGSGSQTSPWRTLSRAATVARAGDVVIVHNGDYRQEDTGWGRGVIPFKRSGTVNAPITFRAAPGADKVLVANFILENARWLSISGFRFTNPNYKRPANWREMPLTVVDQPKIVIDPQEDWTTREAKVAKKYATYLSIKKALEYDTGIDLRGGSHISITNSFFEGYWAGIQCKGCSNVSIDRNEIRECVNGIYTWQPAPALVDSHISHNTFEQNFEHAIDIREGSRNVLVNSNVIKYSGISHITLINGVEQSTVQSNRAISGGFYSETMSYPGSSAINVHTSGKGIVVERNLAAFQVDPTNVDGNGFIVDLMNDGHGVLLRNNIAFRNEGAGLNTTISPNCQIINNAFVENGFGSTSPRRGAGIKLSRDQDVGQTIVNNIFVNNADSGILTYKLMDKQKTVDHNLYFSTSNLQKHLIWDGYDAGDREYDSLAAVQQQLGLEAGGKVGDPKFLNVEDLDFLLLPESAAIDAGMKVGSVVADLSGRERDGPFDIGPLEFTNVIPRFRRVRTNRQDVKKKSTTDSEKSKNEESVETATSEEN